jgi:hypothetical protein
MIEGNIITKVRDSVIIDPNDEQGEMKCVKQPLNIFSTLIGKPVGNPCVELPCDRDLVMPISFAIYIVTSHPPNS